MSDELAAVKGCCTSIVEDVGDRATWECDDKLGAMLAVVDAASAGDMEGSLDRHFQCRWDETTVVLAPHAVQEVAQQLGGIREGQALFTTAGDEAVIAYAAWWPWGSGEKVSVRVGLWACGADEDRAAALRSQLIAWFAGRA